MQKRAISTVASREALQEEGEETARRGKEERVEEEEEVGGDKGGEDGRGERAGRGRRR